jgi:ABC-type lipoprotein release transport system permease subunit
LVAAEAAVSALAGILVGGLIGLALSMLIVWWINSGDSWGPRF